MRWHCKLLCSTTWLILCSSYSTYSNECVNRVRTANLLHWSLFLPKRCAGLGPQNRSSLFRVLLLSDHHPTVSQPWLFLWDALPVERSLETSMIRIWNSLPVTTPQGKFHLHFWWRLSVVLIVCANNHQYWMWLNRSLLLETLWMSLGWRDTAADAWCWPTSTWSRSFSTTTVRHTQQVVFACLLLLR